MGYLFAVTLLWAFSFSLIGVYLAGQVDAWFSVLIRVALATLVFLPFLKKTPLPLACKLMLIGALQLGIMYGFYYHSFLFLTVPEVLLFTVMTPLYITLLNDALNKQFNWQFFIVAFIGACSGAPRDFVHGTNRECSHEVSQLMRWKMTILCK